MNYFESAFINGEVALQVHEDYFAGSLANMEDDYGFVFFPKGPRAETYLYAPSDNIMVIPACYDADRAWKIAFAYNLFTNPPPATPTATTGRMATITKTPTSAPWTRPSP